MITVRLLGGAKKAVGGRAEIQLDRQAATLVEVLQFLQGISSEPRLLDPSNLILAVNGVDSSVLGGSGTTITSGDKVTIVTVVHGGFTTERGMHVTVVGIKNIEDDPGSLIDRIRFENPDVQFQAVRADSVFGVDHVMGILRIVLKAKNRGIMIANRIEAELLLRLSLTDQISEAVAVAGIEYGKPACFIAFSDRADAISRFESSVKSSFMVDGSVILPNESKKNQLAKRLGTGDTSSDDLLNHLLERAAILAK